MRFAVPVLPRPQGPAKRTWPIPVRKVHRGASQTGLAGARRAHSFGDARPLLAASNGTRTTAVADSSMEMWVRCARRPTIQLRAAGV